MLEWYQDPIFLLCPIDGVLCVFSHWWVFPGCMRHDVSVARLNCGTMDKVTWVTDNALFIDQEARASRFPETRAEIFLWNSAEFGALGSEVMNFQQHLCITQVYGESSVWEQTHEDQGNRGIGEVIGAWNILLAVASIQHFFLFNQWVIFRNGGTICVSICGRFLKSGMPPKPWVSILKGLILDHLELWAPIF